jgi:hypothetical protein
VCKSVVLALDDGEYHVSNSAGVSLQLKYLAPEIGVSHIQRASLWRGSFTGRTWFCSGNVSQRRAAMPGAACS